MIGLTSIVTSLMKNHANVNIKDKTGDTPLDIAIERNDKTIATLLIPSSTNLNVGGWKSAVFACVARKGKKLAFANFLLLFPPNIH